MRVHRESWLEDLLCPDVDAFLDVLFGDRVETDNEAIERVVELEVLLLHAFHVHDVDLVVVRLAVFASLVFVVRVFVQGVDEREVKYL